MCIGSRRPFDTNKSADHFGKVTDPGARAQGGEGITKAGILRPPQELDSMSIRSVGSKPSIQKSGSRSSMFVEHMNYEMEDTVSEMYVLPNALLLMSTSQPSAAAL